MKVVAMTITKSSDNHAKRVAHAIATHTIRAHGNQPTNLGGNNSAAANRNRGVVKVDNLLDQMNNLNLGAKGAGKVEFFNGKGEYSSLSWDKGAGLKTDHISQTQAGASGSRSIK